MMCCIERGKRSLKTELPYERLAMHNAVIPQDLVGADVLCYLALCHVYKLYNDKLIGKEQGAAMKRQIMLAYEAVQADKACAMRSADLYKFTELARCAARKNPCAETALALAETIDGRGWEKVKE